MKHYSFPRTLLHTICRASLLLLLAAACTNDNPADDPNADGERVTVEFLVPGVTSVGSDGQTRAASALPEGSTVRILAVDIEMDTLSGNQAYYVKGGRLVPCTVDDNGKFIAEDPNGKMALKPNKYDFCVCTPALKMTLDASVTPCITVLQNMDYAASVTQGRTIAFTGAVTLDPLNHECARLQLVMNSDDAAITAMTVKSATLTGFSDDKLETMLGGPLYLPIGSGTKSATTTAFVRDAANPKLSTADLFLLPCSIAAPVKVTYEIAYTVMGIERTETVSADLPKLILTKGKSYTLTANFAKDGGIHLSISDWEQSGQDNSMGEGTYPYVLNGNVIVSKDFYGSAGAIYHKSWATTPSHNVNSGYADAIAPRFEVQMTNIAGVSWNTSLTSCVAPWRMPTRGELLLMYNMKNQLTLTNGFPTGWHWAATEAANSANACVITFYSGGSGEYAKGTGGYNVRCVREGYPYITKNAVGRMLVVVSKDEYGSSGATLHPNWATTPAHYNTDAVNNTMSAAFEVMSYNLSGNWYQATGTYHATHNPTTAKICSDGWRMPTITELNYMAKNQGALGGGFVQNNYWSATEESTNAAQAHMQGFGVITTLGPRVKEGGYTIRCVRDL